MLLLSWAIIGYGLLLVLVDVLNALLALDVQLSPGAWIPCWAIGLLVIAAGLASNQGRRSLRLTGLYLGMLMSLWISILFLWRAFPMVRAGDYGPGAVLVTVAVVGIATILAVLRLQSRSDIATRGYVVPIASRRPSTSDSSSSIRRSEAG